MTPTRSVTLDDVGAWLIKCNPARTDLQPMLDAGMAHGFWCVAANYRSGLIRPGHRVLFWVSAHPQRGIWGAGTVTGDVAADPTGQLHVPVRIPLFDEPVPATELATVAGLRTMEVFRSPQQANPSWVSVAEMAELDSHLPG